MIVELKKNNGQPHIEINSKNFNLSISSSMYEAIVILRLLGTGLEIKFENFRQFRKLINQINELHKK